MFVETEKKNTIFKNYKLWVKTMVLNVGNNMMNTYRELKKKKEYST